MKMKIRTFGKESKIKHLLLVSESLEESRMIDFVFGDKVQNAEGHIANVEGSVQLSDGYGEHYIRLQRRASK
jgi:hypothetical protein